MGKWAQYLLVFSISAVTLGLILVIIFISVYLVPYRQTPRNVVTKCLIVSLVNANKSNHHLMTSTEIVTKWPGYLTEKAQQTVNNLIQDNTWINEPQRTAMDKVSMSRNSCYNVNVIYEKLDGAWVRAQLASKEASAVRKTPCQGCVVSSRQTISSLPDVMTSSSHPDCYMTLNPDQDILIKVNSFLYCSYLSEAHLSIHPDHVTTHLVGTSQAMNLIIWPTVLFIAGFVGIFFACIQYQYSDSTKKSFECSPMSSRGSDRKEEISLMGEVTVDLSV